MASPPCLTEDSHCRHTGPVRRHRRWPQNLLCRHNNHHGMPSSARHGMEWWEFDLTWTIIRGLQAVGLATNVKLPTEQQKAKLAF